MGFSDSRFMCRKINMNYLICKFNKSYIDEGNDIEFKKFNFLFTLTNTDNQRNNMNKNFRNASYKTISMLT